jgi:CBS domain-containing protein
MVTDLITARPETSVMKVAALMLNRKLVLVPVVDDDNRVVGVVSRNDVSTALTGAASEED